MRRQFAELPDLVRYLLIALGILLLWWFLRWLDKDDGHAGVGTRASLEPAELAVRPAASAGLQWCPRRNVP